LKRRRFIQTGMQGAALTLGRTLAVGKGTFAGLFADGLTPALISGLVPALSSTSARADTTSPVPRAEIVRVLAEGAPNSLDPHGDGFNRESFSAFANVYDCLVGFDRTSIAESGSAAGNGLSKQAYRYDYHHLTGQLATSFESLSGSSSGGAAWRFHLRRDAKFHSGNPVTADAVKWSLDRAVSLPASQRQLASGSLTQPSQFVVEDTYTLRIDLPRADRYALPNLALSYAAILDATQLRSHANASDPWATAWLREHAAGGGAYRVATFQSGQRIDYVRYDEWKSGPLPMIRRAIAQAVPDASSRMASLARGDADIVLQLAPREFDIAGKLPGVATLSIPLTNTFRFLAFNTQQKPFDDVRVRQAIAYALPYNDLFEGVARGHGKPLFDDAKNVSASAAASGKASASDASSSSASGSALETVSSGALAPVWPQVYPYGTNLARARALLREAGLPNGFQTTLTLNVSDAAVAEPAALLIQHALAAIGITISIEKAPGAQWGALQTQKRMPFFIDWSSAWFNDPDYFYRIFFEGDWRWNFSSFHNTALTKLTDAARWETNQTQYDSLMRSAAALVIDQAPLLPLWLPAFDVAMREDLQGFTYYIHGQVDFRNLHRG